MSDSLGLYVHIPFCKNKCAYCDFYSVTGNADYSKYTDALVLHMQDYSNSAKERIVDTVYIGGGTPTVLPKENMLDVLYGINRNFKLSKNCEFTIEANPATVNSSDLRKYKKYGVNRISFGMQSANDDELKALGRIHRFDDVIKSFKAAKSAGFENISADLMYGIPLQTSESLIDSISRLIKLGPTHISLYGLKIEEGTPFAKRKDSLNLPDEDTEYNMYCAAVEFLAENGYKQYEISNFAKEGYESKHNLRYWNCEEYLGLGPGAHSYFNCNRFSFKKDISLYINALLHEHAEIDLTDEKYYISPSERVGEYIMLQLRLSKGINTVDFRTKFGLDFEQMYKKELKLYTDGGFMKKTPAGYAFTLKGMYVSSYILSSMLDFDSDIITGIADGSDK